MIVAGALLLDRVATNSDLHHLAPLRSNTGYAGTLINPAFPRTEEDMWKVDSISIWKTECFQHQQRSDWLAAMPGEAQLFAPRRGQKSTHSIPFEAGRIITIAAA